MPGVGLTPEDYAYQAEEEMLDSLYDRVLLRVAYVFRILEGRTIKPGELASEIFENIRYVWYLASVTVQDSCRRPDEIEIIFTPYNNYKLKQRIIVRWNEATHEYQILQSL
jgi:hypothetical protein